MAFLVTCKCGKDLKLPDRFAEKKVRCPGCRTVVIIPPLEARRAHLALPPAKGERSRSRPEDDERDDTEQLEVEAARSSSKARVDADRGGLVVMLWLVLGVVVLLAIGGAVAAVILLDPFGGGGTVADKTDTAKTQTKKDDGPKDDPSVKSNRLTPLARLAHKSAVNEIAVAPDGKLFVTAGDDASILWDAAGKEKARLEVDPGVNLGSHSAAFSPNGKTIAVSTQGSLYFWDVDTGKFVGKEILDLGSDSMHHLCFTGDGNQLAALCSTGLLKVFDPADRKLSFKIPEAKKGKYVRIVLADDGVSVLACSPYEVERWHLRDKSKKALLATTPRAEPYYTTVACSSVAPLAAVAEDKPAKAAYLFDAVNGPDAAKGGKRIDLELEAGKEVWFAAMAFSPDGKWLATGTGATEDSKRCVIQLWDTTTGKAVVTLEGAGNTVTRIVFSRDMTRLAASSLDNNAYVWDLTRAKFD
jgi:hypothetical protein